MKSAARPLRRRHFIGPPWVEKAVLLRESGLTNVEIGRRLKLSDSVVSLYLRMNASRMNASEWRTPLQMQTEFDRAITQATILNWAQLGIVKAKQSGNRWMVHRPSLVDYVLKMLDRRCLRCSLPIHSVRALDRFCWSCSSGHTEGGRRWRQRWEALGKRLRDE